VLLIHCAIPSMFCPCTLAAPLMYCCFKLPPLCRGDTLWSIARAYAVRVGDIMLVNDLDDVHSVGVHTVLLISPTNVVAALRAPASTAWTPASAPIPAPAPPPAAAPAATSRLPRASAPAPAPAPAKTPVRDLNRKAAPAALQAPASVKGSVGAAVTEGTAVPSPAPAEGLKSRRASE